MSKEKTIRANTSVNIDQELWKEAKIEAIKKDITISEMLENAIREYIKKKEK